MKKYKLIERDFQSSVQRMLGLEEEKLREQEIRKRAKEYEYVAKFIVSRQCNMATPIIKDSFARKVIAYLATCLADASIFHQERSHEQSL